MSTKKCEITTASALKMLAVSARYGMISGADLCQPGKRTGDPGSDTYRSSRIDALVIGKQGSGKSVANSSCGSHQLDNGSNFNGRSIIKRVFWTTNLKVRKIGMEAPLLLQ